jgi:DNA-binding NarL/FixJ family response regulator
MGAVMTVGPRCECRYPVFVGCDAAGTYSAAMSATGAEVRQRISDLCRSGIESRQLRAEVLAEIRRVVEFDAYAWLLSDPESRVGSAPLAQVPDLAELPQLIRLKYTTRVNRWTNLAPNTCATLAQATAGDLSQSLLWRDLLCRYGVTDVASMVFADQFGCWGFLDLWRIGGSPALFSAADQAFLSSLAPRLTHALRASQAATFAGPSVSTESTEGPTVLLLSPQLAVVDQTAQSDAHLRILLPTGASSSPIPAAAYNVAAQLLAVEHGVDSGVAQARTHLAGTRWLTLRAARLAGDGNPLAALIAVTIEPVRSQARVELYARAAGLTPRETDLLHRLARGLSNRQLAAEMELSPHTVPDHLKAIFSKTRTNSRSALVARALGAEQVRRG